MHIVCNHCFKINRVPAEKIGHNPNCGHCHNSLFQGKPIDLTQAHFDHYITHNDLFVIVDFWAPWCGPCKTMAPVFLSVANQWKGRIQFAKVNTEAEAELAQRYQIRSIPTLILFQKGKEVERLSGAVNGEMLTKWLQQFIEY